MSNGSRSRGPIGEGFEEFGFDRAERSLDTIYSEGHRQEAPTRRIEAIEELCPPDRALRSVAPGGPLPKRYSRNLIAEIFAEKYASESAAEIAIAEAEGPEGEAPQGAQKVVIARKPAAWRGDDGDDEGGGGPAASNTRAPAKHKGSGIFGFGKGK